MMRNINEMERELLMTQPIVYEVVGVKTQKQLEGT
jgi:hypothetical protein